MKHFDCIVIGGGIIGLFSAYEMSMRGHSVLLVDKDEIGSKAPPSSAGVLIPYHPWRYDRAISQLVHLSQKRYLPILKHLVKYTGQDLNYWTSGMLLCGVNEEESANWLGGYDIPFKWLSAADIKPKVGNIQTKFQKALWLESIAQLSPAGLAQALVKFLAQQPDVTLMSHSVANIRYGHEKVLGIEVEDEKFGSSSVIVTAGAWTPQILEESFPLTLIRHQSLTYDLPAGLVKSIFVEDGLQIIPTRDGKVYIGSDNLQMGFDRQTNEDDKYQLQALAETFLPCLKDYQPLNYWEGLNSRSDSGIPIIAEHPKYRRLFLNTGFFKLGLQVAPASAYTLANIIEGTQSAIDVRHYRMPMSNNTTAHAK